MIEKLDSIFQLLASPYVLGQAPSVSFKGDPSLRQSAFLRKRYESVVDGILPQVQIALGDMLLNRCVYRLFLNLNSGEVRTSSIFEPFKEEVHLVKKLTQKGYVERHFSAIAYDDKVQYLKRAFDFIAGDPLFQQMPEGLRGLRCAGYEHWSPVGSAEIVAVVAKLSTLREVDSFYLRNISLSILEDVVRMQFNCDGTHFVTTEGYQQFIVENL